MTAPKFFRFQVFVQGNEDKKNTVGMAYLKEGQNLYTLRLWTFLEDKFFLLPNKDDSSKYLIMTREPNKIPHSKNKYFWNIVGNAKANPTIGALEMNFDLFDKKVFMSLFPEKSGNPHGVNFLEEEKQAA